MNTGEVGQGGGVWRDRRGSAFPLSGLFFLSNSLPSPPVGQPGSLLPCFFSLLKQLFCPQSWSVPKPCFLFLSLDRSPHGNRSPCSPRSHDGVAEKPSPDDAPSTDAHSCGKVAWDAVCQEEAPEEMPVSNTLEV